MTDRWAVRALAAALVLTAAALAHAEPALLATVNGQQLTTEDLDVELFLMRSQNPDSTLTLPPAEGALQRLIQNTLLFQEGQRLGLDEEFSVTNQVAENVRHRSLLALVDSVAFAVPEDVEDRREAQFRAIDDFIASLEIEYDVHVDSTLLHSLDYGSADPEVQRYLRESEDVLCTAPTGIMRVRNLTRNLLFQEFHGLVGKPDAAEIRDGFFGEWLTEALLSHEAEVRGYPDRPEMKRLARYQTRDLVVQETINVLADVRFDPSEDDVRAFYEANIEHVTPPGRLKVASVMLADEEAARTFKKRLDQGADMDWLADRTAEIVDDVAALPTSWLLPQMLGLEPGEARVGLVMEPMEVPGGWVVAVVTEMEETAPVPLDECRDEIMRRYRAQATKDAIQDAVKLLQDSAEIEIVPGAEDLVAAHMIEWKRTNDD